MTFKEWLEKENKPLIQAAQDLGVPYEYVRRYANERTIPNKENMQKIVAYTNGEVTANDFYEVSE